MSASFMSLNSMIKPLGWPYWFYFAFFLGCNTERRKALFSSKAEC